MCWLLVAFSFSVYVCFFIHKCPFCCYRLYFFQKSIQPIKIIWNEFRLTNQNSFGIFFLFVCFFNMVFELRMCVCFFTNISTRFDFDVVITCWWCKTDVFLFFVCFLFFAFYLVPKFLFFSSVFQRNIWFFFLLHIFLICVLILVKRECEREKFNRIIVGGQLFRFVTFFFHHTFHCHYIVDTTCVCVVCTTNWISSWEFFCHTTVYGQLKMEKRKKNFCSGIQVRTQKHRTNFVLFFTGKKNVHSFKKKRKKLNSIQFHSWYSGMQIFLFSFCFTCHFVFPLILYLKINSFSPGVHTHTHLTFIHTFARNTGVTIVSDCVCVCLYVNKFLIDRPKYEKKKETKTSTKFFISKNK